MTQGVKVADIFLSYAREDVKKAKLLAEALEKQGWSVFWDRISLLAGQDFDDVIDKAIKEASCMIVAWSAASKQSDWVRGEATKGRERKILIPILFESVDPPIAFLSLHTENLEDWQGDIKSPAYLALCKAVKARIGTETAKEEPVVKLTKNNQSPEPQGFFRKRSKWITITGFLIMLIVFFYNFTSTVSIKIEPKTAGESLSNAKNSKSGNKPDKADINTSNITEPDLVKLPGETFDMGEYFSGDLESPVHKVKVDSFSIGRTEVTFDEYDRYAEATGTPKPFDEGWGRGKRPVINVTWDYAVSYAQWLSKETGKNYHLPSEAQWEFAARAGSYWDYYWGKSQASEYAWFYDNSSNKTQLVGEKKAEWLWAFRYVR